MWPTSSLDTVLGCLASVIKFLDSGLTTATAFPSFLFSGSRFRVHCSPGANQSWMISKWRIRDLLTSHISKVCRNVETEPLLQPLDNEVFNLQSTVTSREVRLDMKAGSFWTPGVTAFFDVCVTHVNSRSNQGNYTATIFKEQENEKKRKYNERVMDVEMGTFTPLLVFGTNKGMGLDCQNRVPWSLLQSSSCVNSADMSFWTSHKLSWIRPHCTISSFSESLCPSHCKTTCDRLCPSHCCSQQLTPAAVPMQPMCNPVCQPY